MNIDAISSASQQMSASGLSNPAPGVRQDFRSLEQALLNGDLTGAKSAFATLQRTVTSPSASANSNSIASQLGQSSSSLAQDMQAVSSALDSNDLSAAQKAFAKLKQDMQSAFQTAAQTHHGHHAHHGHYAQNTEDSSSTSSSSPLSVLLETMSTNQSSGSTASDLMNALQSLAASNPKVAGDLVNLVNDLNTAGKVINATA